MKKYCLLFISTMILLMNNNGNANEEKKKLQPLLVAGGGYLDTRKCPGGILQIEYKYGKYFCYGLRPQATFLLTQYASGFIGFGIGWELYMSRHMLIIPSFVPGIYWRGRGRDLGCPLEFQSGLEIAYESLNKWRIGLQISHVSNAHLSKHNPGFNAFTLRISIPLNKLKS